MRHVFRFHHESIGCTDTFPPNLCSVLGGEKSPFARSVAKTLVRESCCHSACPCVLALGVVSQFYPHFPPQRARCPCTLRRCITFWTRRSPHRLSPQKDYWLVAPQGLEPCSTDYKSAARPTELWRYIIAIQTLQNCMAFVAEGVSERTTTKLFVSASCPTVCGTLRLAIR